MRADLPEGGEDEELAINGLCAFGVAETMDIKVIEILPMAKCLIRKSDMLNIEHNTPKSQIDFCFLSARCFIFF